MKFLVAALLVSTTAAADPCAVNIVRAPDDVRAEIERWVAAESTCARSLDVRVVTTDNGLYLLASGSDGSVHERIVPDAQAAGVLVASWIALDAPHATAPVAPALVTPMARPIEPIGVTATAQRTRRNWYSLGVAAVGQISKGYALRGEVTIGKGGWLAYGAGSLGRTPLAYYESSSGSSIDLYPLDKRLAVGGGYQWERGRWQIGARAGLQLAWWNGDFSTGDEHIVDTSFFGVEGSVLINRQLNRRWWFIGGVDAGKFMRQDQMSVDFISVIPPAFDLGVHGGLAIHL